MITTYALLQTEIESWLGHTNYTARLPTLIQLFEAAANRRLRVRQQETSTTLTPSSGSVSLPSDYLSTRRVTWTGSTRAELEYVTPSYLQAAYPTNPSDTPCIYTIEGSTLKVRPISATALEFLYYAKIPALATTDPNWLLTEHPDCYLFGSLVEAEAFGSNDDRLPLWKARRDEIFGEIERLSNKSRGVGGMRIMGATP